MRHLKQVAVAATAAALAVILTVGGAAAQKAAEAKAMAPAVAAAKAGPAHAPGHPFGAAAVDQQRLIHANSEPGSWLAAGRDYDEQRYSPLTQINKSNVAQLGLAWYGDINSEQAQESTPVIVDGVMYLTTNWSMVKAYNAKTGEKIWEYDPHVDRAATGPISCCGTVNRGVAAWHGKIYVAALDGRLIALDGKTGAVKWSVQTTDPKQAYTITAVPRIANGKVFIGNAGAEYTVRGYIGAWDAESGKQLWRFYTVPGNPNDPNNHDPEILKRYASTWHGDWWKFGGGATVWDTTVYDPKTNLVYFGTGNGLSWSQDIRSPGGGDNLFVSSIIAVNADTGAYVWHYQETPGDEWDFDNTNPLMTADLKINGKMTHVLMQAPKMGFFYVWEARTGKLLSAGKYAPENWADHIDIATGRPVQLPQARYGFGTSALVYPAALGAHNWHPMSFSPRTGLVYIPVTENSSVYTSADPKTFQIKERQYNTGNSNSADSAALYAQPGAPARGNTKSYLQAWDPVAQKEVWRAPDTVYGAAGTMVTASDIVFKGDAAGMFSAYDAKTGAKLWSAPTQARIVAAASTYMIDNVQYVAILVGAGGPPAGQDRTSPVSANNSRILVYKLGGDAKLPTAKFGNATTASANFNPPLLTATNEAVIDGQGLYSKSCFTCHGQDAVGVGTPGPDLRKSALLNNANGFVDVIQNGRPNNGMPAFKGRVSATESASILAYVIKVSNDAKAAEQQATAAGGRGGAPGAPPAGGGRGGGRGGRGG